MIKISRRDFIKAGSAAIAFLSLPGQAIGQQGDKFDLVIKGGEVLDPAQNLRAKLDIGIKNAVIAALSPDINPERGVKILDAKGKLVTPGLIDLHVHVDFPGSGIGLPLDEMVSVTATTTYVSAGDTGVKNFPDFMRERAKWRTRLFGFVHISSIGLTEPPPRESVDLNNLNVDLVAKTLAENQDVLLGVKVIQSTNNVGSNGLEPLKRAVAAAERSGTKGRVMCHAINAPGNLGDLLDLLRPGDIVTHVYSGKGKNIVQNGKVLDVVFEAKKRGVIMDVAHGWGFAFDYTIAEPAIAQGLLPDVISSDITANSYSDPGMPVLPWVMSKFWNMGLPLEQVVAMATINPAKILGRVDKLGTLQLGAPADVSLFEIVEKPVKFIDTKSVNNSRDGRRYLKPYQTVVAGHTFSGLCPYDIRYP